MSPNISRLVFGHDPNFRIRRRHVAITHLTCLRAWSLRLRTRFSNTVPVGEEGRGYCLGTEECVLSTSNTFVEGAMVQSATTDASEGTWRGEGVTATRMGPMSWIVVQILPRYHGQWVMVSAEQARIRDQSVLPIRGVGGHHQ